MPRFHSLIAAAVLLPVLSGHAGAGQGEAMRIFRMIQGKMPCPVTTVTLDPSSGSDVYHITCDFTAVKNAPKDEATFDLTMKSGAPMGDIDAASDRVADLARAVISNIEAGKPIPRDGSFDIVTERSKSL